MAEVISVCELLCEVADLIQAEGWVQYAEHSPGKGRCLSGACREVIKRKAPGPKEKEQLEETLALHLAAAIKPGSTDFSFATSQAYNDAKGRKQAEVVAKARQAGTCLTR